jgi:hypothetical protein
MAFRIVGTRSPYTDAGLGGGPVLAAEKGFLSLASTTSAYGRRVPITRLHSSPEDEEVRRAIQRGFTSEKVEDPAPTPSTIENSVRNTLQEHAESIRQELRDSGEPYDDLAVTAYIERVVAIGVQQEFSRSAREDKRQLEGYAPPALYQSLSLRPGKKATWLTSGDLEFSRALEYPPPLRAASARPPSPLEPRDKKVEEFSEALFQKLSPFAGFLTLPVKLIANVVAETALRSKDPCPPDRGLWTVLRLGDQESQKDIVLFSEASIARRIADESAKAARPYSPETIQTLGLSYGQPAERLARILWLVGLLKKEPKLSEYDLIGKSNDPFIVDSGATSLAKRAVNECWLRRTKDTLQLKVDLKCDKALEAKLKATYEQQLKAHDEKCRKDPTYRGKAPVYFPPTAYLAPQCDYLPTCQDCDACTTNPPSAIKREDAKSLISKSVTPVFPSKTCSTTPVFPSKTRTPPSSRANPHRPFFAPRVLFSGLFGKSVDCK